LPTEKVPPTLVRQLRGRTSDEWLARAASPDAAVRAEAPWALAELIDDPQLLGPMIARAMQDPDPTVRYAAVVALGRVTQELDPTLEGRLMRALVQCLQAPERGLARAAWSSALELGERVVPSLAQALSAPEERLASEAARLLAALGSRALAAAPALAAAVAVAPLSVRLNAVRALERLGAKALPAMGLTLVQSSGDGAVALLGLIQAQGAKASSLAPGLVAVLLRPAPDEGQAPEEEVAVSQAAEEALVAMGEAALPALDAAKDQPRAARVAARIRASAPR
jgi:HEAT repeat protein